MFELTELPAGAGRCARAFDGHQLGWKKSPSYKFEPMLTFLQNCPVNVVPINSSVELPSPSLFFKHLHTPWLNRVSPFARVQRCVQARRDGECSSNMTWTLSPSLMSAFSKYTARFEFKKKSRRCNDGCRKYFIFPSCWLENQFNIFSWTLMNLFAKYLIMKNMLKVVILIKYCPLQYLEESTSKKVPRR